MSPVYGPETLTSGQASDIDPSDARTTDTTVISPREYLETGQSLGKCPRAKAPASTYGIPKAPRKQQLDGYADGFDELGARREAASRRAEGCIFRKKPGEHTPETGAESSFKAGFANTVLTTTARNRL